MSIKIGTRIGKFRIIEMIGRGGMAEVYKARHLDLDSFVTLKLVRVERFPPEILPGVLKRFRTEARKMAQLSHPNIVKVTDYGTYEGIPYLVMDYLPGGTFRRHLGKPMPYQQAVNLILPIADALSYAHGKGVIHRDVKPTNILLTENGRPMLSDFGVAKVLDNEETQGLTITGAAIGTSGYMAPEQAMGKKIDQRVDIYSLGVILYELVTGRRPYDAETPIEVVVKQSSQPLPKPSLYNHEIPSFFEKILSKALAMNPEDRFNSAEEFTRVLRKILEGKTPVITTNDNQKSIQKFMQEIKQMFGSVWVPIAAACIALVGIGFFIAQHRGDTPNINNIFNNSEKTFVDVEPTYTKQYAQIVSSSSAQKTSTPEVEKNSNVTTSINNSPDCTNEAEFINETIPDGTFFQPGADFTKTWVVKNIGSCIWNDAYHLIYDTGDQMSGDGYAFLGSVVNPGDEIEISLDLTAPTSGGAFRGYWHIQSDTGEKFYKLYTMIRVNSPHSSKYD